MSKFYLGQDTLGGIVFYIYRDQNGEEHGLIVSKNESASALDWQTAATTTNARRSYDGVYNCALIIGSPAVNYATSLADGGFTDWYLPSIDELYLLFGARFHVNRVLEGSGFALLGNSRRYWSSTENNGTRAFEVNFNRGFTNARGKTSNNWVRAIRAF